MKWQAVVTDHGFPDVDAERTALAGVGAALTEFQCKGREEVIAATRHADAVLTQWAPIDEAVIREMERCRIIVRYGIGVDNVDLEAAGRRGIPVVNVPDYALDEVADHAMALLLASVRKIPDVLSRIREGVWETNPFRPMVSLRGRVLGLAGFGNIARRVAARAQAFGLLVAAYDPFVGAADMEACGVHKAELAELLTSSDFISVHLPLTDDTRHLFDKAAFGRMKDGMYLVNTSRGGVVRTADLIEALESGKLAGAGLDVLEQEPPEQDSPLLRLPGVTLTSHCAWYTEDALRRLQQFAADEIVRVLRGGEAKHVVNRKWLEART